MSDLFHIQSSNSRHGLSSLIPYQWDKFNDHSCFKWFTASMRMVYCNENHCDDIYYSWENGILGSYDVVTCSSYVPEMVVE